MVIRVLAGAVPMIFGALIFSGVAPVGQWVFGQGAPNPVDVIRTMGQADEFIRAESRMGSGGVSTALSADQVAAMTSAQRARYAERQSRARIAAIRSQAARSGGDPDAAGWAPSSGGWGR